ncbi:MAG: SpoIIE family protein phosphatase [Actinomycetota bacterium]
MAHDAAITPGDQLEELERTLESLREDSEVAHVLLGLSAALAEVRAIEDTLELTTRMVPDLLGADRAFAVTSDSGGERFELQAYFGFEPAGAAALRESSNEETGLPVLRKAMAERTPILSEDPVSDGYVSEEEAVTRRVGSYVAIPLIRWGDDFGGIGVIFEEPHQFGGKEHALARGIGRQVGVALSNARQFNLLRTLSELIKRIGSRLRLDDVIEAIGSGAAELLDAEYATVYLLDQSSDHLIAAGLNGHAGRLPERLSRLDLSDTQWSELRNRTIRVPDLAETSNSVDSPTAAIAAPIRSTETGSITGAIVAYFSRPLGADAEEIEAIGVLAAQGAMAIENARRFERQRTVARSLQKGLLVTETPEMEGIEIGTLYEAAAGEADVGGDFFDVFELSEGTYALVVGDVSGKGAEAAAQTAMAKYMLRAFATRNSAPSSVLFHLNNALVQSFEEDRFTTLIYAVLDAATGNIVLARGGHPSPLIYRAKAGEVDVIDVPGGLVGVFEDQHFEQESLVLDVGDTLLTFTDGLSEARSGTELYGRDRIVASLSWFGKDNSGRALAEKIFSAAQNFGEISDDAVVFTVSRTGNDS